MTRPVLSARSLRALAFALASPCAAACADFGPPEDLTGGLEAPESRGSQKAQALISAAAHSPPERTAAGVRVSSIVDDETMAESSAPAAARPLPSRRRRRRSRGRLIVLDRVAPRRVPREADATGRGGGRAGLETRLGLESTQAPPPTRRWSSPRTTRWRTCWWCAISASTWATRSTFRSAGASITTAAEWWSWSIRSAPRGCVW
jgi:hypothetical protein